MASNPYLDDDDDDGEQRAAFNMKDEYEGDVQWIQGEAYFGKKKEKRAQTKDQTIYGVYANDDEEVDEGMGERTMGATLNNPMRFVSSGIFMPSAEAKKKVITAGEDSSDEEDNEEKKASKKFKQDNQPSEEKEQKKGTKSEEKEVEKEEEEKSKEKVPERFIRRKKDKEAKSQEAESEKKKKKLKLPSAKAVMDKDFGSFGKFSNNYGLKILMKQGFTGRLGKNENGIVNPLLATVRKGRVGLGGIKETQQSKELEAKFRQERGEPEKTKEQEEEEKKKKEKQQEQQSRGWKKTKAKEKVVYKTASELGKQVTEEETVGAATKQAPPQVIVDMRSGVPRYITVDKFSSTEEVEDTSSSSSASSSSSSSSSSVGWTPTAAAIAMPELAYNVKAMVENTEDDIKRVQRDVSGAQDRIVTLSHDHDELQKVLAHDSKSITRMEQIVKLIAECQGKLIELQSSFSSHSSSTSSTASSYASLHSSSSQPAPSRQLKEHVLSQLDIITDTFDTLSRKYREEIHSFDLLALVAPLVLPLLRQLTSLWDPLSSSSSSSSLSSSSSTSSLLVPLASFVSTSEIVSLLARWRLLLHSAVLHDEEDNPVKHTADALYSKMTDEIVFSRVRFAFSLYWLPRDYEPAIHFFQQILPIVSMDSFLSILVGVVLPRVRVEVDHAWNPRVDRVPIHQWILPWLHLAPSSSSSTSSDAASSSSSSSTLRSSDTESESLQINQALNKFFQPVYQSIRLKLTFVLQVWHPADASAFSVISPWAGVWSPKEMELFLAHSIVPRLATYLRTEFFVNPQQQVLEPFTALMCWEPIMPTRLMLQLLCQEFFPKWFMALFQWISPRPKLSSQQQSAMMIPTLQLMQESASSSSSSSSQANFDEVSTWYIGWKNQFPVSLRDNATIKLMFTKGLDLMNLAISGSPLEAAMEQIMNQILPLAADSKLSISLTTSGTSSTSSTKSSSASVVRSKISSSSSSSSVSLSPPRPPPPPSPPRSPSPVSSSFSFSSSSFSSSSSSSSSSLSAVDLSDEYVSMSDVLTAVAEKHNIKFVPNVKRGFYDGKQIYTFGRISICYDKRVVYMYDPSSTSWTPISLSDLVERSSQKHS